MTQPRIVDLSRVQASSKIKFEEAHLPPEDYDGIPFAQVRYSIEGMTQALALRLDLDKRAFLDHFEDDPEKEEFLSSAASEIVDAISEYLEPTTH